MPRLFIGFFLKKDATLYHIKDVRKEIFLGFKKKHLEREREREKKERERGFLTWLSAWRCSLSFVTLSCGKPVGRSVVACFLWLVGLPSANGGGAPGRGVCSSSVACPFCFSLSLPVWCPLLVAVFRLGVSVCYACSVASARSVLAFPCALFLTCFYFSVSVLFCQLVFMCRSCYVVSVVFGFFMLSSVFSRFSAFGFSGSRSGVSASVLSSVLGFVPPGSSVFVGCASGVDGFFRSAFPSAAVFSVSSGLWGAGRGAFAGRSAACVRAVSAAGGLWVAFPSSGCPAGLVPSSSSSRCFCGSGSGSWASLAFALGLGVPCLVFSPSGVPVAWGFSPVPGCPGWFGCSVALGSAPVQLSLF
jgi:hypothetical protein